MSIEEAQMKKHLMIIKKSIVAMCICAISMPSSTIFANTYTPVVGGAAGIGINSDGTWSNSSEKNNSESLNIDQDLSGTILEGIYVDKVDISGLTYDQAISKIKEYVNSLNDGEVTLKCGETNEKVVSAGDLGITWNDTGVIADALSLGKTGNIVERYKEKKDLQYEKKVYDLKLIYDYEAIRSIVEEQADLYNIEPVSGNIVRENGEFKIDPGTAGVVVDVESSVRKIATEMSSYTGDSMTIALDIAESNPRGSSDDLSMVKDLLGSFTTSFSSSGSDRSGNVRNGTSLVNGTLLYPGEQFSMYKTVSPFTEENGYFMAGSYLNGMVVESLGGGICQVSSTLYNAVIRAELQVDERYNHSMIVTYVQMSSDAAISGTSKDFKFTNSLDYPIYIEGYTTDDKKVVFNIYGVETRPTNRTIEFESVELSKTEPEGEKIVTDSSQPLGYVSTQSPHIGYTGELYKIVKVDGVETERIRLNKSNYQASPRTATVGTATDNPAALAALQTAIATGSIDYVKSTISSLNSAAAAAVSVGNI